MTARTRTRDVEMDRRSERRLLEIWRVPGGLRSLSEVNQTYLGRYFIITGFAFFLIGGVLALVMRLQLAAPENMLVSHELYNQLFTMHGTTMMFLFAVPMVEGLALYLIPQMIGARDLVFPRLSSFGYWCYLFGGLILYSSFFVGHAPDTGWYMYVPLTGTEYSPGPNADFWLIGVTFAEISAMTAAVELAVSILKSRAPGMSINRMPLFAWYMLVVAFMIMFGFPALILGSILLEIERAFGWPFFQPSLGGDALLWQHYFWIFGHPEVYVIFLPAAGIISMIVPTFARRPLVGHEWVILAVVGTGFVSMGLWVHHMFTTGLPLLSMGYFSSASMTVSVLSGIQVFAWLATLWLGRPVMKTPLLFTAGFIFIFVLGGLTGVMVALIPFDWQAHDTYFVVAHFHYVLIGGMVFPLFAALYYWLPNSTGRMLSERIGRWNFWTMFIGFNVAFFPMHLAGLYGMPRRVYTYGEGLGWELPNLISTVGAFVFAAGVALFLWNAIRSFRHGEPAGHNPWNAGTLEWATDAPIPPYNFRSIPKIESAYPLWDQDDLFARINAGRFILGDASHGLRVTAGSTPTHGELDQIIVLPKPTWLPLLSALCLAIFFVGLLLKNHGLAGVGLALAIACFLRWAWLDPVREQQAPVAEARQENVRLGSEGPRSSGWWGLIFTLIVDALLYIALAFGFVLLWSRASQWPPGNFPPPNWSAASLSLVLLIGSATLLPLAGRAMRDCKKALYAAALLGTAAFGSASAALTLRVLLDYGESPQRHAFSAMFHAMVGYQLLHVGLGVLILLFALARGLVGGLQRGPALLLRSTSNFWYYTVGLSIVNAALLYFLPTWP